MHHPRSNEFAAVVCNRRPRRMARAILGVASVILLIVSLAVPSSAAAGKAGGKDLIANGNEGSFQTVRIYKRGGRILFMVDNVLTIAWKDDEKTGGPLHDHPGSIGLRQMGHTEECEYGHLKVYPLKPSPV